MAAAFAKKKYFLEAYTGITFRHGGIGGVDMETILRENGFTAIRLKEGPAPFVQPLRWLQAKKIIAALQPGDLLLAQFPVYPRMYRYLLKAALKKKTIPVLIIMDIDGLKSGNPPLLAKEIRFLRRFTYFIVHGDRMEHWLRQQVPQAVCSRLGPFDFLAASAGTRRDPAPVVNYSGNLRKSRFIFQLRDIQGIRFLLYGEGGETAAHEPAVLWKGVYQPHEMPSVAEGSFGLVWDGDGIDGPAGVYGNYMQYIFHHKISLYILAGLPIFIYSGAGAAGYVTGEGLGWKIDSLQELTALVNRISAAEYAGVREKMKQVAGQLMKGQHLLAAIERFNF
ncbi:MAG: hypothetical protein QM664_15475 [Flavihumibacter sp.]